MKVLVTGGSGMIGGLIIDRAIQSQKIDQIVSIVRTKTNHYHDKLTQVSKSDFTDWQSLNFSDIDVVFFCLGVYTGSVTDPEFKRITVDFPVSFAQEYKKQNPNGRFILLSGQGADRTEQSRVSFARYKGMAENQIAELEFSQFNSFRPSYIYPVTPRNEPNLGYKISRWLYPLIKKLGRNYSITSEQLADAMLTAALTKQPEQIIENKSILEISNA